MKKMGVLVSLMSISLAVSAIISPVHAQSVTNNSFEWPSQNGSCSYNTPGGTWTFTSSAGIEANGSGMTAPNAPDGTQTAFLQSNGGYKGTISQTISFPTTGTFEVSFQSARRTYGGQQSFNVAIDGTIVGSFSPTSSTFTQFTTAPFNVTVTGNHVLSFVGTASSGDDTDFIDSVSVFAAQPSLVANSSFESPNQNGGCSYNTPGGVWTFTSNSGIEANGSGMTAPNAPSGVQTAFVQCGYGGNGSFSQVINFPTVGTFDVAFQSARRAYGGQQSFNVTMDGIVIGSFSPTTTTFSAFTTAPFAISTIGNHVLAFVGTATSGDDTDFIDSVAIFAAPLATQPIGLSGCGNLTTPAISPTNIAGKSVPRMMINTDMGGAYISDNGGTSWWMIDGQQLHGSTACYPAFNPQNADIIYAGYGPWTPQGLKVSLDGGHTWSIYGTSATNLGVYPDVVTGRITLDADQPTKLMFVGTSAQDVWTTTTNGQTWSKCAGPVGNFQNAYIDRSTSLSSRTCYVCTDQGVWRSTNGGSTWSECVSGLPSGSALQGFTGGHSSASGTILYCAVHGTVASNLYVGGIYKSTNQGASWSLVTGSGLNYTPTTGGPASDCPQYLSILAQDTDPTQVWAYCQGNTFFGADHSTYYYTNNAGSSWNDTFQPDPRDASSQAVNCGPCELVADSGYYTVTAGMTLAICSTNAKWAINSDSYGQGWVTNTNGTNWSWNTGTNPPAWNTITGQLASGSTYPSLASLWMCNGLTVTTCWDYKIDPFQTNRRYIGYSDFGMYISTDSGSTWSSWNSTKLPWTNTCYQLACDPSVPGRVYGAFSSMHDINSANDVMGWQGNLYSYNQGGVGLSTDSCADWAPSNSGLPNVACTGIVIDPNSPTNNRTLYAAMFTSGIYKSTNSGATWTEMPSTGLPASPHVVKVVLHKDGTLFAQVTGFDVPHSWPYQFIPGAGVYRFNGSGWTCLTTNVPTTDTNPATKMHWPRGFAVDPNNSSTIYVTEIDFNNSPGVFRTTNGGASWTQISNMTGCYGITFNPLNPTWVYLVNADGTTNPLFISEDSGTTFLPLLGLPFTGANSVIVDQNDPTNLYVMTFGGGAWKLSTNSSPSIANGNHTLTPQNATWTRLDAAAGGTANGTGIDIWPTNGASNQYWTFTNMGGNIYKVQPSYDLSSCLAVNTSTDFLDIWADNGGLNQRFTATWITGNLFSISPLSAPATCMDVYNSQTGNGTAVDINNPTGGPSQQWAVN